MSKRIQFIAVVLACVIAGGSLWWFIIRPKSETETTEPVAPKPKHGVMEVTTEKPFLYHGFEVTVNSLAYSAGRVTGYETLPLHDQKFLVLTFQARNKEGADHGLHYLKPWSVLDERGREIPAAVVLDDQTHDAVSAQLEPEDARDATAVFVLDAKAKATALLLTPDDGAQPVQADIATPIDPLDPAFAEDEDATGATVRPFVAATVGKTYPFSYPCDVTIDSLTMSPTDPRQAVSDDGKHFLIVALTITNATAKPETISSDLIRLLVKTIDNGVVEGTGLIKDSSTEDFSEEAAPGASVKAREVIEVPLRPAVASLIVEEPRTTGEPRPLVYDLKSLAPDTTSGTPSPVNP